MACQKASRWFTAVPAVDHNGPRESWIDGFDLFEELQHADGRERNSKVRPAGEVELRERSGSLGRIAGLLDTNRDKNTTNVQRIRDTPKAQTFGSKEQFGQETRVAALTYWMQNLRMV